MGVLHKFDEACEIGLGVLVGVDMVDFAVGDNRIFLVVSEEMFVVLIGFDDKSEFSDHRIVKCRSFA